MDETRWECIPGVSRSFPNSSGTKITPKNNKNMKPKISKNIQKHLLFSYFGGFQAFGGVPGEDFDMQNPNLRSKMMENAPQRVKKKNIEI